MQRPGLRVCGGVARQADFTPSQGTMFRHSPGRAHAPLLHLLDPSAVSARPRGLVCYGRSDPKTKCAEILAFLVTPRRAELGTQGKVPTEWERSLGHTLSRCSHSVGHICKKSCYLKTRAANSGLQGPAGNASEEAGRGQGNKLHPPLARF